MAPYSLGARARSPSTWALTGVLCCDAVGGALHPSLDKPSAEGGLNAVQQSNNIHEQKREMASTSF